MLLVLLLPAGPPPPQGRDPCLVSLPVVICWKVCVCVGGVGLVGWSSGWIVCAKATSAPPVLIALSPTQAVTSVASPLLSRGGANDRDRDRSRSSHQSDPKKKEADGRGARFNRSIGFDVVVKSPIKTHHDSPNRPPTPQQITGRPIHPSCCWPGSLNHKIDRPIIPHDTTRTTSPTSPPPPPCSPPPDTRPGPGPGRRRRSSGGRCSPGSSSPPSPPARQARGRGSRGKCRPRRRRPRGGRLTGYVRVV